MNMVYFIHTYILQKCINIEEGYHQNTFTQQDLLNMGAPIKFVNDKDTISSNDPEHIEGKH